MKVGVLHAWTTDDVAAVPERVGCSEVFVVPRLTDDSIPVTIGMGAGDTRYVDAAAHANKSQWREVLPGFGGFNAGFAEGFGTDFALLLDPLAVNVASGVKVGLVGLDCCSASRCERTDTGAHPAARDDDQSGGG